MDRFFLMQCFTRAVETGSFSAVARELGTGQPNVSRNIAALEQHLGTRLMHRSTRKLTLTPEGERYYAEARQVLDAITQAESNARGENKPSGLLRVASPTSLGKQILVPWVAEFLDLYPELQLDLVINDRFVDLVEGGVDLAIRIGVLKDSSLRARRIGASERVCVASTEYLAKHPAPKVPEDLLHHSCIVYTLLTSGTWAFRDSTVPIGGRFKVNTTDGVYMAVLSGLGIGYGPPWLFEDVVRDGRVKVLLADHVGPPTPIQFVYSASRLLPQKASVFMDFIAEKFRSDPVLHEGALARLLIGEKDWQ